MLHIILLILKIIGILLLVILGFLFLVLLVVLLVPLRYRVAVEHGEAFYLKGRAHWLLHLIHADISHIEGVLHIRVRVLGFVLYDNLKPKEKKEKLRKSKAKKAKSRKAKTQDAQVKNAKVKNEKINSEKVKNEKAENDNVKNAITENAKNIEQDIEQNIEQRKLQGKEAPTKSPVKSGELPKPAAVQDKDMHPQPAIKQPQESESKIHGLLSKIHGLFGKIRELYLKLIAKLQSIRDKIKSFCHRLKDKLKNILSSLLNLKRRWNLIYDFLRDEINREGFHTTFVSLKRLLKHILPTRLHSEIIFGTGDPCSTGQLLGVMGIFYSFYGDKIRITPDFENKRLKGRHDARGRIRMVTVLIIVTKLLLNKRFKQLRKNIIILKEAL